MNTLHCNWINNETYHDHTILIVTMATFLRSSRLVSANSLMLLTCLSISELNKNPVEGFSAGLIDDEDIYKWEVVIIGPQDTLL